MSRKPEYYKKKKKFKNPTISANPPVKLKAQQSRVNHTVDTLKSHNPFYCAEQNHQKALRKISKRALVGTTQTTFECLQNTAVKGC